MFIHLFLKKKIVESTGNFDEKKNQFYNLNQKIFGYKTMIYDDDTIRSIRLR